VVDVRKGWNMLKVFNDLCGLEKHISPNMLYNPEVFHTVCQAFVKLSQKKNARKVPTTFNEMLLFNASVMGYGASTWMSIVLVQFDVMVTGLLQVSSAMRGVEPFPIMCP